MFHCASNFRGFQAIVAKGRQTNRNSKSADLGLKAGGREEEPWKW